MRLDEQTALTAAAVMTPEQIRAYNRRIAHPAGLHLCPKCLEVKPRTLEHFQYEGTKRLRKDGSRIFRSACRACKTARAVKLAKARYQADPVYRAKRIKQSVAFRKTMSPAARKRYNAARKLAAYRKSKAKQVQPCQ